MFTYLVLNCIFILLICLILGIKYKQPSRAWWFSLACLFILTLVFDSLIIASGIVAYDPSKILGIKLILAPIEDFFYPLLAIIVIPYLWKRNNPHVAKSNKTV